MTARESDPDGRTAEGDERYRTMFDHAPDAIVVIDLDTGKFVDANPNAVQLFGLSHAELLTLGPVDLSPEFQPDGRSSEEKARLMLGRAFAGEIPVFEWVHTNAIGEHIDCEVRLVRMPPLKRQLVRGSITDIRERKRAEAEIARSEREFRSLAEHSPDAIIRVNQQLQRTYVNPAAVEATGIGKEDLLGKRPTDNYPGIASVVELEETIRRELETGEPQQFEHQMMLDEVRYLQTSVVPERDEAGAVTSALSITRDVTSLRRAAEAEMRLAEIVGSAMDAIMSSDLNGTILTWNNGAERLFGYTAAEVIGRTTEFLFEDSGNDEREQIRARLQAGETISGYIRDWPRKDQSTVTVSSVMFPLKDSTGQMIGTASVARDISQELALARALARSEERLRHVLAEAGMGDWSQDPVAGTLQFSEEAARLYGRTSAEMPKTMREALALFHPDDVPRLREWVQQPENIPFGRREYRIRMPDGRYRWIAGVGQVVSPDGRLVSGLIMDITDEKTAEIALRESEARFRSVVDNSPDYITRMDRDLRHEFVNKTAEREAGLDPTLVLGKRSDELGFPPEQGALFVARQQQVLESGEILEYEYPINSLANPEKMSYRRARLVPERSADGSVEHIISIVTDITSEKETEAERERIAERMREAQQFESLGVMAAGIAHDFNNLLVAMLGNAGLALMEIPEDSPARQTIHEIERAAERAAELTRQMLAYSGKGRLNVGELDLSSAVNEVRAMLATTVKRNVDLKYALTEPLPPIEADLSQMRQVVVALVSNAADAIGDGEGTIDVSTRQVRVDREYLASVPLDREIPEGDYVALAVSDTGSGIDSATRPRIFDPFFTTKFAGRGLGLAAVLGIVHGHRGAIAVDSVQGRGSTFTVVFPVVSGTSTTV